MTPRIPDAKVLVSAYLRADADIQAIVVDRVGVRTPDTTDEPWIKITQIGDTAATNAPFLHSMMVHLQLDCYGGADRYTAEGEASLLARTSREVLDAMPPSDHEGGKSVV